MNALLAEVDSSQVPWPFRDSVLHVNAQYIGQFLHEVWSNSGSITRTHYHGVQAANGFESMDLWRTGATLKDSVYSFRVSPSYQLILDTLRHRARIVWAWNFDNPAFSVAHEGFVLNNVSYDSSGFYFEDHNIQRYLSASSYSFATMHSSASAEDLTALEQLDSFIAFGDTLYTIPSAVTSTFATSRFMVYPTVATSVLHVKIEVPEQTVVELTICDVLGKCWQKTQLVCGQTNDIGISTRDLPEGVYFVEMIEARRALLRKVLIQR